VEDERKEHIPEDLLNILIHQFFKQEGTRMSKDANTAVGRYMETFVREALARAAWAREEGGGGGDLEVEDLERLAPQLVLDF
jgi:centromere protein X